MRRVYKIILWAIGVLATSVLVFVVTTYWIISNEWKESFTEEQMIGFASEISDSKELDPLFYKIHDKLFNNDRHKSILSIKVRGTIQSVLFDRGINETPWPEVAANYFPHYKIGGYGSLKLGLGLEKFISPEKCFDFSKMRDFELLRKHGYPDIKEPYLLKDTVDILEFITIPQALTYYRNRDNLDSKIRELKSRLK